MYSLTHVLCLCLCVSLSLSLSLSLPPAPPSLPLSLPPCLPPSLPPSVPPSLPPCTRARMFQMKVKDNSVKRRKVNMIAEELRALEKTVSEKVTRLLLNVVWALPTFSKVTHTHIHAHTQRTTYDFGAYVERVESEMREEGASYMCIPIKLKEHRMPMRCLKRYKRYKNGRKC
jgi:hypothetical protein